MDNSDRNKVTRRSFMRDTAFAAAGLSSALAGCKAREEEEPGAVEPNAPKTTQEKVYPSVPRRKLGKTNIEVPALSLGTMFNLIDAKFSLSLKRFEELSQLIPPEFPLEPPLDWDWSQMSEWVIDEFEDYISEQGQRKNFKIKFFDY